jgi:chromosomal replication initiation ATPase DnaA
MKQTELLQLVCSEYDVNSNELLSMSLKGDLPNARITYVMLLEKFSTRNRRVIARIINRKSHSSVCDMLEVGGGLYESDRIFRRKYDSIIKNIHE